MIATFIAEEKRKERAAAHDEAYRAHRARIGELERQLAKAKLGEKRSRAALRKTRVTLRAYEACYDHPDRLTPRW